MDNPPDKPGRVLPPNCFAGKAIPAPPGRKVKNMAQLEREAARRKWLLMSGAVAAALVVGALIGRFLLP
jgi:hypothetical protein